MTNLVVVLVGMTFLLLLLVRLLQLVLWRWKTCAPAQKVVVRNILVLQLVEH